VGRANTTVVAWWYQSVGPVCLTAPELMVSLRWWHAIKSWVRARCQREQEIEAVVPHDARISGGPGETREAWWARDEPGPSAQCSASSSYSIEGAAEWIHGRESGPRSALRRGRVPCRW
jgi:hypothetical protein